MSDFILLTEPNGESVIIPIFRIVVIKSVFDSATEKQCAAIYIQNEIPSCGDWVKVKETVEQVSIKLKGN